MRRLLDESSTKSFVYPQYRYPGPGIRCFAGGKAIQTIMGAPALPHWMRILLHPNRDIGRDRLGDLLPALETGELYQ